MQICNTIKQENELYSDCVRIGLPLFFVQKITPSLYMIIVDIYHLKLDFTEKALEEFKKIRHEYTKIIKNNRAYKRFNGFGGSIYSSRVSILVLKKDIEDIYDKIKKVVYEKESYEEVFEWWSKQKQ